MSVNKRISLKTRFTLLIVALVAGAVVLLGALVYQLSSEYIRASIARSVLERAEHMAQQLDQNMSARVQEVLLLTNVYSANQTLSEAVIRSQLEQIQDQYSVASWIGFLDAEGVVRVGTGGILEGANISHRPVYRFGRRGLWVGDVHEPELLATLLPNPSGEPIKFVDVAAPVFRGDGELHAVLAMHLSWEWAENIMQRVFDAARNDNYPIEFFVIAQNQTVLLGAETAIGKPLSELVTLASATRLNRRNWDIQQWQDGKYLTGIVPTEGTGEYSGLGWTIIARVPVSAAFEPVTTLQQRIATLGLLLVVIFGSIGWFFSARFSAPLIRLAKAADAIKSLTGKVDVPNENASPELSNLSQSLNQLLKRLQMQRQEIDDLEDIVHTDPLTGLPNRAFLDEYLSHAIPEAERANLAIGVMFIDFDGFKEVNDKLGHHAGDLLLKRVATRLKNVVRAGDVVARVGGDEFVMVVKAGGGEVEPLMKGLGGRIIEEVSRPVNAGEKVEAKVGGSVGAAWWPYQGKDAQQILKNADAALYQAKREGKGRYVLYTVHAGDED
ncbi:MAG: GGDEF domain protein [Idiomarinaceae bacterium HL-53]|nr:MAG: GGDEF domain protein [Idiomarinaceae bacterium HL-53]CUS49162.1 diguanylate cyclase (GGDEF) domain-containing protein [Idiomarinaceae bacterium HL-53]